MVNPWIYSGAFAEHSNLHYELSVDSYSRIQYLDLNNNERPYKHFDGFDLM